MKKSRREFIKTSGTTGALILGVSKVRGQDSSNIEWATERTDCNDYYKDDQGVPFEYDTYALADASRGAAVQSVQNSQWRIQALYGTGSNDEEMPRKYFANPVDTDDYELRDTVTAMVSPPNVNGKYLVIISCVTVRRIYKEEG